MNNASFRKKALTFLPNDDCKENKTEELEENWSRQIIYWAHNPLLEAIIKYSPPKRKIFMLWCEKEVGKEWVINPIVRMWH